jgi:hypothetical protein
VSAKDKTSFSSIEDNLAADKLSGAPAIAAFIGEPLRRTYYLLERGMIPAGQQGSIWVASRTVLREHYNRLTAGQV